MSLASASGGVSRPMLGPLPPTCDVEKNCASMREKSCSASIRSIKTEPTIPRQPMMPTFFISSEPNVARTSSSS